MEKNSIDPEWDNVFRYVEEEATSVIDVLLNVPIFSLLTSRELQRVAQAMHLRKYAQGECVIRSGASQSGFYVIVEGAVDVVSRTGGVLGTLHSPELIGEFALLDDNPLEDIANTRRIAAVIRDGRYLDREDLAALLADLIERNRK